MNENEEPRSGQDASRQRSRARIRENSLVQRLRRSYQALGLGRSGCVLVGFSGGADSLALMSLLANLARHVGFEVRAVHVDHGARGESATDAQTARTVANALGVDVEVMVVPAESLARHPGVGWEEAMRRERYRIFAEAAARAHADVIAVAHHQGDQAETVLLHLLRGSGIRGASAMRPVATLTVPWWDEPVSDTGAQRLRMWRPLLGESAEELQAYAESLGSPIVQDPSNQDVSFRRNAIRHDVIPVLERVAPGATLNLARFAELASADSDELDRQARAALDSAIQPDELERRWLLGLPLAIRRRVIQFWITRNAPVGREVSFNRIDEVLRVASAKGRARMVEIGDGVSVRIAQDTLTISHDQ
ncbi:MAG: tRNA lysidine(34) synthetase TilS [Thermomicrobiales bacterium]